MAVSVRFIAFLAAIIGILQGVAWMCMTIAAILIATDAVDIKFTSTYNGFLNKALVTLIKEDFPNSKDERIIQHDILNYWIYFYLAISLIWESLSAFQLFVVLTKKENLYKTCFTLWASLTFLISVSDIVLAILLYLDYDYILGLHNDILKKTSLPIYGYMLLATGITMAIAARGFILWIVNVVVSIILVIACQSNNPKVTRPQAPAPFESFDSIRSRNGSVDCVNDVYARSNSFEGTYAYETNLPRLAPVPPIISPSERLAKLSKPAETYHPPSEPAYVYPESVKIPRVDYSPPSVNKYTQPKLKDRTHYIYGEKY